MKAISSAIVVLAGVHFIVNMDDDYWIFGGGIVIVGLIFWFIHVNRPGT